jgi:hypothetical protein
MSGPRGYSLEEAIKAQKALRAAAGLGPEQFPIQAFVGMISDEIETLRKQGKTDIEIAEMIRQNSAIEITPEQIVENYASPDERHQHGESSAPAHRSRFAAD